MGQPCQYREKYSISSEIHVRGPSLGVAPGASLCRSPSPPSSGACFIGKTAAVTNAEFSIGEIDDVPFSAALDPADGSFWLAWISNDRYRQSVVLCRDLKQWLPRIGLDIGGVDHHEHSSLEA